MSSGDNKELELTTESPREKLIRELGLDLSKPEDQKTLNLMLQAASSTGKVLGPEPAKGQPAEPISGSSTISRLQGAQKKFTNKEIDYVRQINEAQS